ncbi:twitching motility protein PilT [Gluconobacter albidus]|uniref:Twitching motility protein PilT n=2 Tax=Gluconobacter albidus TaxID=318683 RepID=A0A149TN73_9PROT|nr:twitching motility protein PilT [Gluconobacter albidus]
MSMFWPHDGEALRGNTLDQFLIWCSEAECSRVEIQSDMPVMVRLHGENHQVTRDASLPGEVEDAVNYIFRSATGVTNLKNGDPIDVGHTIWPDRKKRRYPFRLNAVSSQVGADAGISMTFRPLVDIPRPLEDQQVEPQLMDALHGEQGIFLICGATSSGKSTLIGGINRARLEDPDIHCNLLEASAPLEILYDRVLRRNSTVTQLEIPRNLRSFAEFVRASMRREPTDIVVGECRDPETMEASIQAGISGHRLLSSIHTNSCSSTVRRVQALCPADQRDSLTISFVENLRLLVNQRLLKSTDGKRTPVREFLPVTRAIRTRLLDAPRDRWPNITQAAVEEHGQTFAQSIAAAVKQGRITEAVAAAAMKEEN